MYYVIFGRIIKILIQILCIPKISTCNKINKVLEQLPTTGGRFLPDNSSLQSSSGGAIREPSLYSLLFLF